jgi:hypothetical protein
LGARLLLEHGVGDGPVPRRCAVPAQAKIPDRGVSWNYTTWLNIVFLVLAAALLIRFFRTGGLAMLRMMGGSPDSRGHDHMDAQASH